MKFVGVRRLLRQNKLRRRQTSSENFTRSENWEEKKSMRSSGAAQLIKILHVNKEISLVMKLSRGN